ncbi:hypothetical protein BX666DRAFT_1887876 [Dichotomocladium elegans]|nr:hypothetical protein BX666DRAFT_1887876 [Dichotomocladium elegans]
MKATVSTTATFVTVILNIFASTTLAQAPAPSSAPTLQMPTSSFPWKETYPLPGVIPSAKPEWLSIIKSGEIPNAPVVQTAAGALVNPQPIGQDPFCHWSFSTCKRPTDIFTCQKGHWGLSFDDGPTPASPVLYDYLDQHKTKATFFLIGGNVIQYPDMVKRAHQAGHEIAIHTWSHHQLTTLTNEQIVAELKWTEQAIKEVIGVSPVLVRPPQGDMDDRVRNITKQLGFKIAIWDHDTFDWQIGTAGVTPQSVEQTVRGWVHNATGGISLQHDRVNDTVNAAITVLPILEQAFKLTTVAGCANMTAEQLYKETTNGGSKINGEKSAATHAIINPWGSWLGTGSIIMALGTYFLV